MTTAADPTSVEDCVLCQIVERRLGVRPVAETERIFAVMNDLEPQASGHVLLFPKRHAATLDGVDDEDLSEILVLTKRIARAMGARNYNVLHNSGALAGQTVFHVHFHLIPKWSDADGLRYQWETGRTVTQTELYRTLREALSRKDG